MKFTKLFTLPLFFMLLFSCAQNPMGSKVKEPFDSDKYESNNRFFRGVGKGVSKDDNIAKNKADLQAKVELARQVETNVKGLSEQFEKETQIGNSEELNTQFQNLSREVTNTQIVDLRKIGEEKYYNGESYTVYIAYEIKKNAMFRFMKKQAKADERLDEATRKSIIEILDEEIERLDLDEE